MDWLWEATRLGLSLVAMIVSAAAWLYSRRAARIQEIDQSVEEVERRVAMLETAIQAFPSHGAWTDLHKDIAGIRGDIRTSSAEIQGLGAGLKRVERQIGLLMENELRGKQL